jgi:PAS domain S-box-containing protein
VRRPQGRGSKARAARDASRPPPPPDAGAILDAVLAATPHAIVTLDPVGRVGLWSAAAERLFRWKAAEVSGRSLAEVLGVEAQALVDATRAIDRATSRGLRTVDKEGAALHLTVSWARVRGARGAPAGMVAVFGEPAANRDVERPFLEAQRLEVVERLAGSVAHDLKSVLSAIKGFAIVAREGLADNHQARSDTDEILKAAVRGTALAQRLQGLTRRSVAPPPALDVNRVVQGFEKVIRRLAGPRVELSVRWARGPALVRADASQIEQVLVGLALHARDAMPAGGRMMVETRAARLEHAAAKAAGLPAGRYLRITVADSGAGREPEPLTRLFEPLGADEPERAVGLGLPAARQLVSHMGGHLGVSSAPGKGTTFTVDLPLTDETATAEAGRIEVPALSPPSPGEGGGATILVVEDDDLVRLLTVKVLRRRGYRVIEASGAAEAAERAAEQPGPIHLLLSDVGLPYTSGPELARGLAASRPDMKVLFMSGYGRGSLAERGLVPGPGVIEKPFTPEALLEHIRRLLNNGNGG